MFEKLIDHIEKELHITKSNLTLKTRLKEDMQLDSLDIFQLVNNIEEWFNIQIGTQEHFKTLGDIVKYIEQY